MSFSMIHYTWCSSTVRWEGLATGHRVIKWQGHRKKLNILGATPHSYRAGKHTSRVIKWQGHRKKLNIPGATPTVTGREADILNSWYLKYLKRIDVDAKDLNYKTLQASLWCQNTYKVLLYMQSTSSNSEEKIALDILQKDLSPYKLCSVGCHSRSYGKNKWSIRESTVV